MFKKFGYIIIAVAFFAAASFSQIDLSAPIPVDPKVTIGKLQNGLTYYIRKNNKPEKKVELRLAVKVGSLLERDDQQGLAHFLEHMAFNGTTSFKKNELDSYLQSIGVKSGAHSNAYTSFNETVYELTIPTKKKELLDKGLLILSEWASGITLEPAEIEKERGVVLEERRIGLGADERMREQYYPKLFKNSRYAERLPIGKEEVLKNFRYQSLIDFYEDWYRPDLMSVIVVGDIDPVAAQKKINDLFAGIKRKRLNVPERISYLVPDHDETLISIATDKEATSTYAEVYVKRDAKPEKTLRDIRENIIQTFFNWMLNERLDEIIETPEPPFIEGFAGFSLLTNDKDSYVVYGETKPKDVAKTLETLLFESKRAEKFGFTITELARQKLDFLSFKENEFNERGTTDSATFVSSYVDNFLKGSAIEGIEFGYDFAKKIVPSITIAEVNLLARETISERNRVVIVSGPVEESASYPNELKIKELLARADNATVEPYVDKISSEPLVEALKTKIRVSKTSFEKTLGITRWELSNGMKVILKPTNFADDEIILRAVSKGGVSVVSDNDLISAIHTSSIASTSGVKNFTETQLTKKLAGKNASATASISDLFERISGTSTIKDFETLLQLVYLRVTAPNFNRLSFDSYINKDKTYYENALSDPETYFNYTVGKIAAKSHPRYVSPYDVDQYEKLNLDDAKRIYAERFSDLSGFSFILVGNFVPEKIKPLILKYLGNLPSGGRSNNFLDVDQHGMKGPYEQVIRKGIEKKSRVYLWFYDEPRYDDRDRFFFYILGELIETKLTEILREEKSGVYGVNVSAGMRKVPYSSVSLDISFPCSPENVEALTKAAIGEIAKIKRGEIDEKDIQKIREIQAVATRESAKDNQSWVNRIEFSLTNDLDIKTDREVAERIKMISRTELKRVANKYVDLEKSVRFVLMPDENPEK